MELISVRELFRNTDAASTQGQIVGAIFKGAFAMKAAGGGIVGYLLKSAFENREKIKHNPNYNRAENPDNYGGYYGMD